MVVHCVDGSTECLLELCQYPLVDDDPGTLGLLHFLLLLDALPHELLGLVLIPLPHKHPDSFEAGRPTPLHLSIGFEPLEQLLYPFDEHGARGELEQVPLPHIHELETELIEELIHELEHLFFYEVDLV